MAIYQEYPKDGNINSISGRVAVVFNMETGAVYFDRDNLLTLAGVTDGGLVDEMAAGYPDVVRAEVYTQDRGFVPMTLYGEQFIVEFLEKHNPALFTMFALYGFAATGGNLPT